MANHNRAGDPPERIIVVHAEGQYRIFTSAKPAANYMIELVQKGLQPKEITYFPEGATNDR